MQIERLQFIADLKRHYVVLAFLAPADESSTDVMCYSSLQLTNMHFHSFTQVTV